MIRRRQCPAIGDVRSVDFQFAKFLSFVKVLLKGVFRVKAVLQKYLAKGELFAGIIAKPYQDEDRLRTRFDL